MTDEIERCLDRQTAMLGAGPRLCRLLRRQCELLFIEWLERIYRRRIP